MFERRSALFGEADPDTRLLAPRMNMREDNDAVANALKRIAEMRVGALRSEEDVKNKVALPILKALGYDDGDFNYERRTGRGYVDVVDERLPAGIVVETKAPGKKLDDYREQLEGYVFHKHRRDQATVAILTDGEKFNLYGVTEALYKGSLEDHWILSFRRSELGSTALLPKLVDLVGKRSNQEGAISDAIARYRKDGEEKVQAIESELQGLKARIDELEIERTAIRGPDRNRNKPQARLTSSNYAAIPDILRLLKEREAFTKSRGIDRKWLDEQLINKVEGVGTKHAVSWGLIELRNKRLDYEKVGNRIEKVWLIEAPEKSVT